MVTDKALRRFRSKFIQLSDGECWCWNAGKFEGGYGVFKFNGKLWRAPRFAYMVRYKRDPGDKQVCHRCDNPSCVNPNHLFLGTAKDNCDDKISKGRAKYAVGEAHGSRTHPERVARGDNTTARKYPEKLPRGEKQWQAKLTEDLVREIRNRYTLGGISQYELARIYGVYQGTISAIIRRYRWKHVT